ncbi:F0F1 ATP synthase subunit epsilon [Celeribacter sp.]|uniref:F0F1 ATP synthase subunit epsilon n=1 Tax=Celeribacter sp. TaxID=1890673 RepID=UPI003A92BB57
MADTIQFDLVSPERKLASVVATEVQIPGAEGDLTAMAGHAPTIMSIRPGVLTVKGADGEEQFIVVGGFAEVAADSVSVLAEMALPRGEMSQAVVSDLVAQATKAHEEAHPDEHHATEKFLADLVHVAEDMGFHSNLG